MRRVAAVDGQPDVVIVDWQLPDGTALDFVRCLRAEGDDAPILVLVPGTAEGGTGEAIAAGADDCVAKPFTGDDLRRRLSARAGREARAAS